VTTSSPNISPPAGGGDPDPDHRPDPTVKPLMADSLEGAVPDEDDPDTDPDAQTDSVADDKRRSGAG